MIGSHADDTQPSITEIHHDCRRRYVICLPGWATPGSLFRQTYFPANQIIFDWVHPPTFMAAIKTLFKRYPHIRFTLLGFSMGGYLAQQVLKQYPDRVDHLVMIGTKTAYAGKAIDHVASQIATAKHQFLKRFFKQSCYTTEHYRHYMCYHYQPDSPYLDHPCLLPSLHFLSTASLCKTTLQLSPRLTFIHGIHDRIAPFQAIHRFCQHLDSAHLIGLPQVGHIPFFDPRFWCHIHRLITSQNSTDIGNEDI